MAQIYRFFLRNNASKLPPKGLDYINSAHALREADEPAIFQQLTKVLRIKAGDKLVLLDRSAPPPFFDNYFTVETVDKKKLTLRFEKSLKNIVELPFWLELVLCLPNKPDKLTFIIQKAAELGVKAITLVESDFSQFRHQLNFERLDKIAIEAVEQSERAQVPIISFKGKLAGFLLDRSSAAFKNKSPERPQQYRHKSKTVLIAAMEKMSAQSDGVKTAIQLLNSTDIVNNLAILIGPEGGFSYDEKKLIADLKIPCFSLGKRVLRMETAVILSLGLASLRF